jgi:PAS domain S-box-containing protein
VTGLQHAIVIVDSSNRVVHASVGAAELFGYGEPAAMIGLDGYLLLDGSESLRGAESLRLLRDGPLPAYRAPWRLRRRDGSTFMAELDSARLEEPGLPPRVIFSVLDTTEQSNTNVALERALAWAENLLDVAGTMIVALDRQGRITKINIEGCRILGRAKEELVGSDWFSTCLPERMHEEVRGVFDLAMSGAIDLVRCYENPVVNSRGEERVIFWQNTVTRDEQGRITQCLSSGLDVTDRVRADERREAALEEAHSRQQELGKLLEAAREVQTARGFERAAHILLTRCTEAVGAPSGVLTMVEESPEAEPVRMVLESGRMRAHAGAQVARPDSMQAHAVAQGGPVFHNDVPASPWADTVPPGHAPIESALFTPLTAGESAVGVLGLINKPGGFGEGDARLLEGFASVLGLALSRLRSEDALRASEERHRKIFEEAANPIARISLAGIILDCNAQAERVFGLPRAKLVGRSVPSLLHPDDHHRLAVDLADIPELGTYYQRHYRALHAGGHVIDIEVDASMSAGPGGEPEIICQVADVTTRLRSERLERLSHRLLRIFHERRDLGGLAQAFCEEVRSSTGCGAVAIRQRGPHGASWLANLGYPDDNDPEASATGPFASVVAVPIRAGERAVGTIYAASELPRSIPADILEVLNESALQLGIAMQRAAAERELQEQLAFQQEMLDAVPIPVYYKDADGRMVGWNRAWLRSTGWRPSEVAGRSADQVLEPSLASFFAEKDRELLAKPGRQVFEHSFHGPDGELRETVIHRATYSRGSKRVDGIIGAIVDVTALKRATAALQDLNRNLEAKVQERLGELRTLYRLSQELAHTRNLGELGRAVIHHLHGQLPAELLVVALHEGETCRTLARSSRPLGPEAHRALDLRLRGELRRSGVVQLPNLEEAGLSPSLEEGAVAQLGSAISVPFRGEEDTQARGVLLAAAEPEERFTENHVRLLHVAATQIADTLRRLTSTAPTPLASPPPEPSRGSAASPDALLVLDALPQLALLLDAEHRVLHANRAALDHFGLRAEELVGRPLGACSVPWEHRRIEPALLPMALASGPSRLADLRITHPDGRMGLLDLWALPLGDAQGQLTVLLLGEEATQRRELEARLALARKMESVGQLASGIAHEINTPTQYVGDNLQFLGESFEDMGTLIEAARRVIDGETDKPAESREALQEAWDQADLDYLREEIPAAVAQAREGVARITRIVGAMREFSHGGGREKTVVDINRCVDSTVTVARNEWKYVATVELTLDRDLPAIPTHGAELNQVLLNLLINAAQAVAATDRAAKGELGAIIIRTQRRGEWAVIEVQDDGCGIPTELQPRIFEPFFTTKPVGEGTGQGLSISHAIVVDKLGGRLDFVSAPGQGTTFTVSLSLAGLHEG